MAIGGMSFPMPQAYSGGADFTPLANLGNVYRQAQERDMQQAALAQLGNDPTANAQILIKSGVPSLAQLGMNLQTQQAARAEQIRQFNEQQAIRQSEENRRAQTFEEDSPAGRAKKLQAAGLNPTAPENQSYVATGANPPDPIKQQELALRQSQDTRAQALEKREQTIFDQAQQSATPEARRQLAASNPDIFDLKDPIVRNWIRFGGDPSKFFSATQGGLTAIPLQTAPDASGQSKPAIGQLTPSGQMIATQIPPGYEYSGNTEKIDTPTEILVRDRNTGQVVARYPKDVAGAASQKVQGTAQGKAIVDLPKAEADAKLVVDTIDKALAPHPGKAWSVGTMFKDVPALPGTATANYRAILDQLNSQTFLEAYNSLKGGGAISNYEDKRASAAKARLSTAQSPEAFDEALREYKEIVQSGVERMRMLAGKQAPAQAPAQQAPKIDWKIVKPNG